MCGAYSCHIVGDVTEIKYLGLKNISRKEHVSKLHKESVSTLHIAIYWKVFVLQKVLPYVYQTLVS